MLVRSDLDFSSSSSEILASIFIYDERGNYFSKTRVRFNERLPDSSTYYNFFGNTLSSITGFAGFMRFI